MVGKWIFNGAIWECSVCGKNPTEEMGYVQNTDKLYRFCPWCGSENLLSDANITGGTTKNCNNCNGGCKGFASPCPWWEPKES